MDRVDRALADIAALPSVAHGSRTLRPAKMDVREENIPLLVERANEARGKLTAGISRLQLPVDPESVHRRLSAQLSTALVLLYDAGSRGMRAYGSVDPQLEAQLDPWLEELRGDIKELMEVLQR